MRRYLAVASVFIAILASIALAAPPDRIPLTFQSLSSSGVSGDGEINSMPSGEVQMHVSLRGLEPSTTYTALVYVGSQSCGETTGGQQDSMPPTPPDSTSSRPDSTGQGASGQAGARQSVQFQSNPQGMANWNTKMTIDVSTISSVGIRLVSDNSLKACASITP